MVVFGCDMVVFGCDKLVYKVFTWLLQGCCNLGNENVTRLGQPCGRIVQPCRYKVEYVPYCICQIIQGEKLLWFLWTFANRECFIIEIFPLIFLPSTNYTRNGVPPACVKVFPTY